MASSRKTDPEAGFATPAAAVISLAIGVIASAVVATSVAALRQERIDYQRVRVQYALEGAQAEAALQLAASPTLGPARWRVVFSNTSFEAIAEPELPKLGLSAAAALPDAQFAVWGVTSPPALKIRLDALAAQKSQVANLIAAADGAPAWRRCARTAISPYGAASLIAVAAPRALQYGVGAGRTGQLWRLRLASDDGWVDDRIVRFTGSPDHPLSVAAQSFSRGALMGDRCAGLYASPPPR
jgi:hypothetical protein